MNKFKPLRLDNFIWDVVGEVASMFSKPLIFRKIMSSVRSRIYTVVSEMEVEVMKSKEPVPFNERLNYKYEPIKSGEKWGSKFDCAWFHMHGHIPKNISGEHLVALIDIKGEGCIMDNNGTPLKGIARILGFSDALNALSGKKSYDISKFSEGGDTVELWVEGGNNGGLLRSSDSKLKRADIAIVNDSIYNLYFDLLTLLGIAAGLPKKSRRYDEIMSSLTKALSVLKKYSYDEIKLASEILAIELNKKSDSDMVFYATGHAHLDLAWLWPIRETKRKAGRTFSNQLDMINKYPDYVYCASQPQMYKWIKDIYPGLYEKIKTAVANGNIEPVGGMWVEPDCNLPSGESLVRQFLYGKRYFRTEFNKDMKVLFLPDVFGYNGALPQIMKKSGIDYFLTSKMSWNEYNSFPYHSFKWKGIDGTEVIAHLPPAGNYCSDLIGCYVNKAMENYKEKDTKIASILFGVGDGGGGPSEVNLEMLKRQKNLEGVVKLKSSSVIDFFNDLSTKKNLLPEYQGELYLEKHTGTFTTQAKNKLYNRKIENLLHEVETLSTIAHFTKGYQYPGEKLDNIWQEMLLYQFHDIIPGSSIKRVYDESIERYIQMFNELNIIKAEIIKLLSTGSEASVFNSTSFERNEWIKKDSKWYFAEVAPYSSAVIKEKNTDKVRYDAAGIYSDILNVKFGADGSIVSLTNNSGKEFSGGGLNKLAVYRDKKKQFNAWDIDVDYINHLNGYFRFLGSNTFVDGARVVRRSFMSYKHSILMQDVILTAGSPYVEFDTSVDWNEEHEMLRANFVPSVFSDEVTCDIQFGNIKRSTKTDDRISFAQYEICAHKWIDVSDKNCGISLLNDCKYGHRVKDGLISLNLLRSTTHPDKIADIGKHSFRYALYPHNDKAENSELVKLGYSFNNPMEIIGNELNINKFVSVDNDKIIIETVKKAEDCEGIIVRLYESIGLTAKTKLSINLESFKAYQVNLIEDMEGDIDINNLTFTPFEIKTILFKKEETKVIKKEIETLVEKPIMLEQLKTSDILLKAEEKAVIENEQIVLIEPIAEVKPVVKPINQKKTATEKKRLQKKNRK